MEYFKTKLFALAFALLVEKASCLSQNFVRNVNAGFRQREGADIRVRSFAECSAMCIAKECSNFYFKKEANLCNLDTRHAVSPISDPQDGWSYYENPNKGANIALGRVARQSSVIYNNVNTFGAHFAVNGGVPTGGDFCAHTKLQTRPWWKIDLGATHHIQRVVLYNRKDNLGERLQYFKVDVIKNSQSEQCGYFNYVAKTAEVINIMCNGKPEGTGVKITITTTSYLTLCEVEVYKWQ